MLFTGSELVVTTTLPMFSSRDRKSSRGAAIKIATTIIGTHTMTDAPYEQAYSYLAIISEAMVSVPRKLTR